MGFCLKNGADFCLASDRCQATTEQSLLKFFNDCNTESEDSDYVNLKLDSYCNMRPESDYNINIMHVMTSDAH